MVNLSFMVAVTCLSPRSTRFCVTFDNTITIITVIIFVFIIFYTSSMFHMSYGLNY
jgi:hypothetical protein